LSTYFNFKISKNGKFQLTGCKNDEYAEKCVKFIWNYIQERQDKNDIIDIKSIPEITFMTVMTNIDFNVGFTINRENLDKYINSNTEYNSLLETSFGYTGVNIKIPMKRPPEMVLKKLIWKNNNWENDNISYSNYLTTLEEKDRMKEVNKNRYNTFLVFHSGNVIMSSMHIDYMKDTYNKFINIIKECRPQIEEKIEA
jgi:TATA-box binding protein (TBP) (component of TFIID and TFIIIB)